jgi:hypothetical protein
MPVERNGKHGPTDPNNLCDGGSSMKVVISIPEFGGLVNEQQAMEMLMRPVAGVPLLMRTALTAARAGASDVLLVVPAAVSARFLQKLLETMRRRGVRIEMIQIGGFDPQGYSSWIMLKRHLNGEFLWLPWNWITNKKFLSQLPLVDIESVDWSKAACTTLHEVDRDPASSSPSPTIAVGVAVTSPESVVAAERFLVANSGKVSDGIHSSFNRRLCWPFLRLLSHTPVTPNAVTFGGYWSPFVAIAFTRHIFCRYRAFLFYIAGLFDEMMKC